MRNLRKQTQKKKSQLVPQCPRNENDKMRLDKVISEGESLTLSEIGKRYGIRAKAAKDIIDGLYPNVKSAILNGHTDQYPRYATTTKKKL